MAVTVAAVAAHTSDRTAVTPAAQLLPPSRETQAHVMGPQTAATRVATAVATTVQSTDHHQGTLGYLQPPHPVTFVDLGSKIRTFQTRLDPAVRSQVPRSSVSNRTAVATVEMVIRMRAGDSPTADQTMETEMGMEMEVPMGQLSSGPKSNLRM